MGLLTSIAVSPHAQKCGLVTTLMLALWVGIRRVGLAPHDVALAIAIGLFAIVQRRRERERSALLGEHDRPPVRWVDFGDFLREHHQLVGCVMRGRRSRRSERVLALAVTTLALLYWKAFFRPPPVSLGSTQGLRSSIWTVLISKAVQQLIKRLIRLMAGRTAAWQASAGWMETLHMHWQILQYWVCGFVVLCLILFFRDGKQWPRILSRWLVNMAFALVVMDLAFCYLRFSPYICGHPHSFFSHTSSVSILLNISSPVLLPQVLNPLLRGSVLAGYQSSRSFQTRHLGERRRSEATVCLLYTSPSPRDLSTSRMPSSA